MEEISMQLLLTQLLRRIWRLVNWQGYGGYMHLWLATIGLAATRMCGRADCILVLL